MLRVSVAEGKFELNTQDIIYLEASRNYTRIYLHDQRCILSAKTLGAYESLLSKEQFYRVRSSHLVNTAYITGMNERNEMLLPHNKRVKIAKRKRTSLLQWLRSKKAETTANS